MKVSNYNNQNKRPSQPLEPLSVKFKKTPPNLSLRKEKLAKLWQEYLIKAQQIGGWQLHTPKKRKEWILLSGKGNKEGA